MQQPDLQASVPSLQALRMRLQTAVADAITLNFTVQRCPADQSGLQTVV